MNSTDAEKRALARRSRAFNLKDRVFCELFPEMADDLRRQLAEEAGQEANNPNTRNTTNLRQAIARYENQRVMDACRSDAGADGALEHSFTYNLVVLAGVVALAFAVRYVILSSQDP